MPRDRRDYGDPNGPGDAGIGAALEIAADEVLSPPADEVDAALATLRKARKILADRGMMQAIRDRLEESKRAVEQSGKEV